MQVDWISVCATRLRCAQASYDSTFESSFVALREMACNFTMNARCSQQTAKTHEFDVVVGN